MRTKDRVITPGQAHEEWTEVLPEEDLFYGFAGPTAKVIAAILFGVICFFVLVATGSIPDPGLMP